MQVTGRELDELARTLDHLDLFDRVVAENGALLFPPKETNGAAARERLLATRPPTRFGEMLAARGVSPISRPRCSTVFASRGSSSR